MSADNGFVIRKNEKGHFVLQMFFMSDDSFPPINHPRGHHFRSLEGALRAYNNKSDTDYWSEYGLQVYVDEITPTPGKRNNMPAIETKKFVRKPFEVEAVQVTAKNLELLARWSGGTVVPQSRRESRHILVKVNRPQTERQTKAFVGDWLLYSGSGFKVYTPKAFDKSFQQVGTGTVIHELPAADPVEVFVRETTVTQAQLDELQTTFNGPPPEPALQRLAKDFSGYPASPATASPATMPKHVPAKPVETEVL